MKDQINELIARITNTKLIHKKIENEFNIFCEYSLPALGKNNQSALILTTILEKYYTTLETCFFRISKFFENNLSRESWHKELLDKMRLEIPNTREAVIKKSSYSELQELLRFRHFSRYYTEMDYDWNRLDIFLSNFPTLCKAVVDDLDEFSKFLSTLQKQ